MRTVLDLGLKLLIILAALPASDSLAQGTTSLEVIARTDQGAVVPGAKVTVRSINSLRTGETGIDGYLLVGDLVSSRHLRWRLSRSDH